MSTPEMSSPLSLTPIWGSCLKCMNHTPAILKMNYRTLPVASDETPPFLPCDCGYLCGAVIRGGERERELSLTELCIICNLQPTSPLWYKPELPNQSSYQEKYVSRKSGARGYLALMREGAASWPCNKQYRLCYTWFKDYLAFWLTCLYQYFGGEMG